jgi:hypothetical protein
MEAFGMRTASLDAWYHSRMPEILSGRSPPFINKQEAARYAYILILNRLGKFPASLIVCVHTMNHAYT